MSKFFGAIGFTIQKNEDGVVKEEFLEKNYKGDLLRNKKRIENGSSINDGASLSNEISILLDDQLFSNLYSIRYVKMYDIKWKVESVDIQYPRLKISIGGVYNE